MSSFLCFIWGALVGIIGVDNNEPIWKILLASILGSFAITLLIP